MISARVVQAHQVRLAEQRDLTAADLKKFIALTLTEAKGRDR
jgi:hypothetical protein